MSICESEHGTTIPEAFLRLAGVARLLSLSKSKLEDMQRSGHFGPKGLHVGRAVLFDVDEVVRWGRAGFPSRERWQEINQLGR